MASRRWLSTNQSAFCTGFMTAKVARRGGARLIALAAARACRTPAGGGGLPALEARLAFLHEGRTALAVIGTVETHAAGACDRLEVTLAGIFQDVVDAQFVGGDRQRRVGADARPRVEDHARMRRPDQLDERAQAIKGVGDAQARRRNAELAVRRGDAHIGLPGDRDPAAEAED